MFNLKMASAILLAVFLCFSASFPLLQPQEAAAGTQPGTLEVAQHKITTAELQTYLDSAQDRQANAGDEVFRTGLTAPKLSQTSQISQNAYVVDEINYQAALPTSVDWSASPYFPPIGNQGQQGSCASFATGYYCKTFQEAKEHNWDLSGAEWVGDADDCNITEPYKDKVMSPAFVYNLVNGGSDVGSDFETPIRLVCNVGVCSWLNMPYYWQDCTRWPSQQAWMEAPLYRSNCSYLYQYLYANTTQGVESLKSWLAAGNIAVVALDARDNLWNYTTHSIALGSQDLMTTDTYTIGELDHAGTIVGYNDTFSYMEAGQIRHGAFKIANSWGEGGWENVVDGCYWISYAAFKMFSTPDNPVVFFQNQPSYQPQIQASFRIVHPESSDLNVTFGYGTPQAPIAAKSFSNYVSGGNRSFCTGTVVFDLTDFKPYLQGNYSQPFYMLIHDKNPAQDGTLSTGTVSYFSLGNSVCSQTPKATADGAAVNLTLNASVAQATLVVSPQMGSAQTQLTLTATGTQGGKVNITYYDASAAKWVALETNYVAASNFTYSVDAPDLRLCSPEGDNPQVGDAVVFQVQDSVGVYNASFTEMRRGLTRVGDAAAANVFGNGTDLSTQVFVKNQMQLTVQGCWFAPGTAAVMWDNQTVASAVVGDAGSVGLSFLVPVCDAGKHTLTIYDGGFNVSAVVSRLPSVGSNASSGWLTKDFTVALTPDYPLSEVYYRVNGSEVRRVSVDGQPRFSVETTNSSLEVWGNWTIYGTGNMQLNHTFISGLKLDKAAPTVTLRINSGESSTSDDLVALHVTAVDGCSGVEQMRFSNDAQFSQSQWEQPSDLRSWRLTGGSGLKTVYLQVQDYAGLTSTVSASITFNAPAPTATPTVTAAPSSTPKTSVQPSASPSASPAVPELGVWWIVLVLGLISALVLAAKRKNCG